MNNLQILYCKTLQTIEYSRDLFYEVPKRILL